MFTKRFLVDAGERCVRAFCASLGAALTVGGVTPASIPWQSALATAGLTALGSFLMSVAATKQPDSISPASFTPPV